MKFCLLPIIVLTSTYVSAGQCASEGVKANSLRGEVFGIVANNEKLALPGSEILLQKGRKTIFQAKTDKDGRFTAGHINPGAYLLTVHYPGLMNMTTDFTILKKANSDPTDTLFIRLDPPSPRLDSCNGLVEVKRI